MSSVNKQILFSSYEVASLYVYDVLFPDYSDFNHYLHEKHVDQKTDFYAHLDICKNHKQYEDMTKKLLQSISSSSFCISQTDIHKQQFPRQFLFDWFQKEGIQCPELLLPVAQQKIPAQQTAKNITININNTTQSTTEKISETDTSQSSNTVQESITPSNLSISVSTTQITVKNIDKNSTKKFKPVEIFGAKKKQQQLFYSLASQGGTLSLKKYNEIDPGSNADAHRTMLTNLNNTLKKSLSLSKNPFNTAQKVITTSFRKISLVKKKSLDALDRETAGSEWLEGNDF